MVNKFRNVVFCERYSVHVCKEMNLTYVQWFHSIHAIAASNLKCKRKNFKVQFSLKYSHFIMLTQNLNVKKIGDMIICSNCDCSKNLLDTILLLLDTIRAIIFFLVNCSKIKNNEKSSAVRVFRAVSLLDKKY